MRFFFFTKSYFHFLISSEEAYSPFIAVYIWIDFGEVVISAKSRPSVFFFFWYTVSLRYRYVVFWLPVYARVSLFDRQSPLHRPLRCTPGKAEHSAAPSVSWEIVWSFVFFILFVCFFSCLAGGLRFGAGFFCTYMKSFEPQKGRILRIS